MHFTVSLKQAFRLFSRSTPTQHLKSFLVIACEPHPAAQSGPAKGNVLVIQNISAAALSVLPWGSWTCHGAPQAPPLPIRGLYKPSSLKQLTQSSADSSPEPGIFGGEGGVEMERELPLLSSPTDLQTRGGLSRGGLQREHPLKVIHPPLTLSHPREKRQGQ